MEPTVESTSYVRGLLDALMIRRETVYSTQQRLIRPDRLTPAQWDILVRTFPTVHKSESWEYALLPADESARIGSGPIVDTRAYARGYIESRVSIASAGKSLRIQISGSRETLQMLADMIFRECGASGHVSEHTTDHTVTARGKDYSRPPFFRLRYGVKQKNSAILVQWLYEIASVYCPERRRQIEGACWTPPRK